MFCPLITVAYGTEPSHSLNRDSGRRGRGSVDAVCVFKWYWQTNLFPLVT